MAKKRKRIGRKRQFDRSIFKYKPIPERVFVRQSIGRAFSCKFCRMSYLDSMIEEFDKLIAQKEMRVAIVDGSGHNLSGIYNLMMTMQGNKIGLP